MGIRRPCYGERAWSLFNCCESVLAHGFADLDYKTAYGHALGLYQNWFTAMAMEGLAAAPSGVKCDWKG